jgi:photosystem II stability/assembly factor-like uncharacterized protein
MLTEFSPSRFPDLELQLMKKSFPLPAQATLRFWTFAVLLVALLGSGLNLPAQTVGAKKRVVNKKSFVKKSSAKSASRKRLRKTSAKFAAPRSEEEFESNPEKRREWFMFERTFPSGELPADARRNAWAARPAEARFAQSMPAPEWKSIGPRSTNSFFPNNWGLTSGRINAVAVAPSNPNLILIGAATGGVWRSTDGGATFNPTSDDHVDLAVGSIAFAPSNDAIVYAGMGDKASGYYGSGVLKSSDGGQSWTRVNNTSLPSPGRISQLLVDPSNPNRVYAAQYAYLSNGSTFASGFFYSTDGGVSWTKTLSGLPRDLVRHPTQPNTLYLAMARIDGVSPNTGGVWKSTDAGLTWTRIYTTPYTSTSNIKIAVTPAAVDNVYVLVGGGSPTAARVEVSADGGATWTNRGSAFDVGQFSYNCYLFVHPANPNIFYVGTRDLWTSADGGATYTNVTRNFTLTGSYTPTQSRSHPDQHHFYISPTDPNLLYIANDGGLWKSTDSASTFQSLNATLNLTMFVSLDLHPTDPTRSYGGTQDNGTQKRTGAQSWREFATGDGGQTFADPLDPSIVYTTYVYGTVYRYTNHGDGTRTTIGTDAIFANDRVAFYPPFVGNGVNSTLYFGTYRLYISTNRGASWTPSAQDLTANSSDVLTAIGVSPSNTNYIYTGSSQGRVMVSTDGGVNFTNVTAGLPTRFIKSITVSPTDPNTAYLTVSGFNSGHVFRTTNAGANWTDISANLPNIPVNTFLIDPRNPSTFYVGTDIGIFRTTNAGGAWETFNMGMPPTIVTELDAQPNGLIQAATYGRGMYELAPSRIKPWTDFDGDGKTDISVFRPSDTNWYLLRSTAGFTGAQFGMATDQLAPGDYDGDGKTDLGVFRDGTWYAMRSSNGTLFATQFGAPGDKPAQNDYDGDGKTDVAVYRGGAWYVLRSTDNGFVGVAFGLASDTPIPADFDGDGKADYAVHRALEAPSNSYFYALQSSNGALFSAPWGVAGDIPVVGDYDGDGKADAAVFRPSIGSWFVLKSTGGYTGNQFGQAGDVPVPGDYDGDGKADLAVFRGGAWYVLNSANNSFSGVNFGFATDIAVPSKSNP